MNARQAELIRQMYSSREHTIKEIADTFGVSHMTVYRHLEAANDGQQGAERDPARRR